MVTISSRRATSAWPARRWLSTNVALFQFRIRATDGEQNFPRFGDVAFLDVSRRQHVMRGTLRIDAQAGSKRADRARISPVR